MHSQSLTPARPACRRGVRAPSPAASRDRLWHLLPAALVAGLFATVSSVSFAALIFGVALPTHVAEASAGLLMGSLVAMLAVAWLGSYPGSIAMAQDRAAPILALAVMPLASSGLPDEILFPTVVAVLVVSAILTGLVLVSLGALRLGRLVRFIPYPVVGGFLAGAGWLLTVGGIRVMSGASPSWHTLDLHLDPAALMLWVPGAVLGLVLFLVTKRVSSPWALPAVLLLAGALVHGVAWGLGMGGAELVAAGLTLGPFPDDAHWQWSLADKLGGADWGAVLSQSQVIGSVLLVSLASLLLNGSALELTVQRELDLDRELRTGGIANLASGLVGGMTGLMSLGVTTVVARMGGHYRIVPVLGALIVLLALLAGPGLLSVVPVAVVGGLLIFKGLGFLHEWVWQGWQRLSRGDYAMVISILLVVIWVDFLAAILVGVLLAVALFVVTYSRISVVKHVLSGNDQRSNVDRSPMATAHLDERAEHIHILRLQGFIFFGTANSLLDGVRARALGDTPLAYLVMDFRQVSGLDSSALLSFRKLVHLARKHDFEIVMCTLSANARSLMARDCFLDETADVLALAPDLDRGLQYCEDRLIEPVRARKSEPPGLSEALAIAMGDESTAAGVARYMEPVELRAGQMLMGQGEEADAIYFLLRGRLSVDLDCPGQEPIRLRSVNAGNFVGEVGVYLDEPRGASVSAQDEALVYRLSSSALRQLTREHPEQAAAFHVGQVRNLARRLNDANNTLRRVLD